MNDPLLDLLQSNPSAPAAPTPGTPVPAKAGGADPLLSLLHGDAAPVAGAPPAATPASAPAGPTYQRDGSFMGQVRDNPHQLGLTARAGITGLAALPNMVGDALNGTINLGTMASNRFIGTNIPQMDMPSHATQNLMDSAGFAKSRDGLEQGVQAATSAVAGVSPSVQLGKFLATFSSPAAKTVGMGLAAAPGMQLVGSAGAGGAASAAAQNGAGPLGQLGAALVGGLAGVGGVRTGQGVASRMAAPTAQQRLAQALRDHANNAAPGAPPKPRIKLNVDGSTDSLPPPPPPPPPPVASTIEPLAAPNPAAEGSILTSQRQLDNIEAMRKIGLNEQRKAAVSGDKHQSGIEYEEAKLSNERGAVMRAQLQKEQDALKGFAGRLVSETGANTSAAPEAVGQSIRAPMQALSDHFDTEVSALYNQAKEAAGNTAPVKPDTLNAALADKNFRETFFSSPNGTTLLGAIDRQVKRFQGLAVDGEPPAAAPNTVASAENLRKWLNTQWSPGNSKLIGQIKEALDSDVGNAGGAGIFDNARKLHAMRRDTLDNPNGISKLLTSGGPSSINQAIADEHVAPKLLTMPTAQFKHVIKTLKSLPEGLQEQGRQAIAEIKGALARRVYAAGDSGGTQNGASVWNAANVTRELNANRSKMAIVFGPDELERFSHLHTAGHVLQTPMAYKGAAAQGYNYLQSGAIAGLPLLGTGAGSMVGGPSGAALGSLLGAGASKLAMTAAQRKMAEDLAKALSNPTPTFPR